MFNKVILVSTTTKNVSMKHEIIIQALSAYEIRRWMDFTRTIKETFLNKSLLHYIVWYFFEIENSRSGTVYSKRSATRLQNHVI